MYKVGVTTGITQYLTDSSITTLDLTQKDIRDEDATILAKFLSENTSITALELGDNNIGDEGAREIAQSLLKNSSLTSLTLRSKIVS